VWIAITIGIEMKQKIEKNFAHSRSSRLI